MRSRVAAARAHGLGGWAAALGGGYLQRVARMAHAFFDLRAARREGRAPATLPLLSLEVTLRCNARCGMCGYINDYPKSGPELTTDELLEIIDEANELGTRIISIGGGEPFLRRDVFDLIHRVEEHGIVPFVHSNGSLLTHARLRELARTESMVLALSLDSHLRERHDGMRGVACFDALIAAARYLSTHAPGTRVVFTFVVTGVNFRDILATARLARDVGVRVIRFTPLHENLQHRYKPRSDLAPFVLAPEHLPELRDLLEEVIDFTRRNGMLTNTHAFLRSMPQFFAEPVPHECYAGFLFGAVDPFGNFVPCYDHAGSVNVRNGGLIAAFRSSEMDRLRQEVVACRHRCWDLGQTEPSLRLDPWFDVKNFPHIMRETLLFLS